MSFGGIRDEAEIRGHRKTYIGSMPGRFVQAMKKSSAKQTITSEDDNINDDENDNFFLEKLGRFPTLEEDVPPDLLLCSDYVNFLKK